ALMALYCLFAQRLYTATAVLHVKTQTPNVTSIPQVAVQPSYLEGVEYFQDQLKYLESKSLAASVNKELGLDHDHVFAPDEEGFFGRMLDAIVSLPSAIVGWFSGGDSDGPDVAPGERVYDVPSSLITRYRRGLEIVPVINSRMVEVRFTSPSATLSQRVAN